MDVIEYKLASNNPTLISHAICKLLDAVKQKAENGESETKITELKFLLSQVESSNGLISITACQALVALAESGVLTVPSILSNLTVCLGKAKHCGAVASAICNLLTLDLKMSKSGGEYVCPFTLKTPQHPLITVLIQKNDAWRDVLSHVQTMMNRCKAGSAERHATMLRPLFLYILCDPKLSLSESCRKQAWHLLTRANGTTDLQIEVLQWLRISASASCLDTNNRILEIAELAAASTKKSLCSALVPLIMSMSLEILRNNGDPRSNLDMITSILVYSDDNYGSVLICLLAEMMKICPSVYLLDIVTSATKILEKRSYNRTIGHSLIASILPWMAYPTILSSEALDLAKSLIGRIVDAAPSSCESSVPDSSQKFERLHRADANLCFYGEICLSVESWSKNEILAWLVKLSRSPSYVLSSHRLVISGLFLDSSDSVIIEKSIDILVELSKNYGQILPSILYKLSYTREIEKTKILLFALPRFARSKENVPIIVATIKTLFAAGKPLNYLAIELYVRALSSEIRFHRYLQTALAELSNDDDSWQSDVACARAIKYICVNNSELGAELVPILSKILNRCATRTGSAASALALNAISALCVAGITEISSAWRVLAPKMSKETRPIVVRAICEFFADIPSNPSQEVTEYGDFLVEIITKLWDYAINSRKPEVIESAFKALRAYKLSSMPLSVLPVEFLSRMEKKTRSTRYHGDAVNEKKAKEEEEAAAGEEKMDNILTYIPENCQIGLLEIVDNASLPVVSDFFRHLVSEEVYNFRTGIYRWPHGEPGNFKYLSERSTIRAIGEYIRHYRTSDNDEEKKRLIAECMKIFSYKYPKALPPIEFSNLREAIEISRETRRYGISLACHQASISPSAKEYLEKYLTNFTKTCSAPMCPEEFNEFTNIYEKLDDVCRAVGSNALAPFLDVTMSGVVEKAERDNESAGVAIFDEIMKYFAKALRDELIHNDNRSLLTGILEKLMDRIDVDGKCFKSYTRAVLELTTERLERMTLPSVWLDVTTAKLRKAIVIRAELVLTKNDPRPLTWMNEIIRASASTPAVHSCLLEQMQRILPAMRLEKTNAAWILDLMRRIGSLMADCKEKEESIDAAIFLCEILFISVVCLSATDCLTPNDRILVASHEKRAKLFPQALASIVQTAYWKDIIPQTMEWLSHMRMTPIPRMYKIVFHNALVSLKNEANFEVAWTKYLSIRAPINA